MPAVPSPPLDPAVSLELLRESTAHLGRSIADLTDDQARGASLCPGWTRGHVLTHLARNADALGNLTVWATTGVETPMYPSREARAAAIESGAGRPPGELVEDVDEASARLMTAFASFGADDWAATWGDPDWRRPAADIVAMRLTEVEVHHVDLDLDYTPAHWPEEYVEWQLSATVADFERKGEPPNLTLVGNDDEGTWVIGDGSQLVNGPPPALLGWLVGRTSGVGLHSDLPLPELGRWK